MEFINFIEKDDRFSSSDVDHITRLVEEKQLGAVLKVCVYLTLWIFIATWLDAVLMPMILVSSVAWSSQLNYPLIILASWACINATMKFFFIRSQLKSSISRRDNLIASLPYAGAVYLMKGWLTEDRLLRTATLAYLNHRKSCFLKNLRFSR